MSAPEDARAWGTAQLELFAETASAADLQSVTLALAAEGTPDALRTLQLFLFVRGGSTYEKRLPSVLAARALLSAGPAGVRALSDSLIRGPRPRYAPAILMMLFRAGRNDFEPDDLLDELGPVVAPIDPPEGTIEASRRALTDYVAEAVVNPQHLSDIGAWLQRVSFDRVDGARVGGVPDILSLLGEGSIRLAPSVLADYENLIAGAHNEEVYQQFLTSNPALLDPLAAEILPKLRLGTEYATDFALRRHDDRWLLVEIEKPQDRVFTGRDDFSSSFTHAYGQVLDFQRWVDDEVSYARTTMPGVVVPRGLLVIGRRSDMSVRQEKKLAQLVSNSARIDVVTFDDLLEQARTVYDNLHRRGPN